MFVNYYPIFEFHQGTKPLLISIPHAGTYIPEEISKNFTEEALKLPDTDWHLPRLYTMAKQMGASILIANYSRYVIDVNRPPDDTSLYPGQSVTGLCPLDTFANEPIYRLAMEPDIKQITQRRENIWQIYHTKIIEELYRIRSQHGYVVLWDAHSIRSRVPRFFTGNLPDLNFGSDDGNSCSSELSTSLMNIASRSNYSSVLNGRFKGGYITRHYGDPKQHIHAIQLEMSQNCYMDENWPFDYLPNVAKRIQSLLECLLAGALSFTNQVISKENLKNSE